MIDNDDDDDDDDCDDDDVDLQVDDRFVVQDFILPIGHLKKAVQFCDQVEIVIIYHHHHFHHHMSSPIPVPDQYVTKMETMIFPIR